MGQTNFEALDNPASPLSDVVSGPAPAEPSFQGYDQIMRIPVKVDIVVGSLTMPVASVMRLGRGAILSLDRRIGEPVDVMVNGRLVARGEIVVLDDEPDRMGVSLTEIVGAAPSTVKI